MEAEMKYILRVYKDGSFSKAAENLFVTQPALSLAVKRVESGLGAPIFDRTAHPLKLTDAGLAYIRTAEGIQHLEEQLSRQIQDLQELDSGELRIGGTNYVNCYILADILAAFSAKYPNIHIDLYEHNVGRIAEGFKDNKFDLILSSDEELAAQYNKTPVAEDVVLLMIPNSQGIPSAIKDKALSAGDILDGKHKTADCPKISMDSLKDTELVMLNPGDNLKARSQLLLKESGIKPVIRMTLNQMVTAFHMTEAGLGASFGSDLLVENTDDRVSYFVFDSPLVYRRFYILTDNRAYVPRPAQVFTQFASAYFNRKKI